MYAAGIWFSIARMPPNVSSYHGCCNASEYRKPLLAIASTFGVASVITSSGAPSARVNSNNQCRCPKPDFDVVPSTSSAMLSMTPSVIS